MTNLQAKDVSPETLTNLANAHVDITGAKLVEIETGSAGSVLWVNVNGVCVLRICRIQQLKINEGY